MVSESNVAMLTAGQKMFLVADEVPTAPSGVMKVNELYIPLEMESSNVPNRFENGKFNLKI